MVDLKDLKRTLPYDETFYQSNKKQATDSHFIGPINPLSLTDPSNSIPLPPPSLPPPPPASLRALVVGRDAGIIIGKSGNTIAEIRKRSTAQVSLSTPSNLDSSMAERILTVSGSEEAVSLAFYFIGQKLIEGYHLKRKERCENDNNTGVNEEVNDSNNKDDSVDSDSEDIIIKEEVIDSKDIIIKDEIIDTKDIIIEEEIIDTKDIIIREEIIDTKDTTIEEEISDIVIKEEFIDIVNDENRNTVNVETKDSKIEWFLDTIGDIKDEIPLNSNIKIADNLNGNVLIVESVDDGGEINDKAVEVKDEDDIDDGEIIKEEVFDDGEITEINEADDIADGEIFDNVSEKIDGNYNGSVLDKVKVLYNVEECLVVEDTITIRLLIGSLIGKQGQNIKKIQELSKCTMVATSVTDMIPGNSDRIVTITGPIKGLKLAISQIVAISTSKAMNAPTTKSEHPYSSSDRNNGIKHSRNNSYDRQNSYPPPPSHHQYYSPYPYHYPPSQYESSYQTQRPQTPSSQPPTHPYRLPPPSFVLPNHLYRPPPSSVPSYYAQSNPLSTYQSSPSTSSSSYTATYYGQPSSPSQNTTAQLAHHYGQPQSAYPQQPYYGYPTTAYPSAYPSHGYPQQQQSHTPRSPSITLYVNGKYAGAIIGKGGCRINEIRSLSGCVVKIEEMKEEVPAGMEVLGGWGEMIKVIFVSGSAEGVEVVRGMVLKRIDSEMSKG